MATTNEEAEHQGASARGTTEPQAANPASSVGAVGGGSASRGDAEAKGEHRGSGKAASPPEKATEKVSEKSVEKSGSPAQAKEKRTKNNVRKIRMERMMSKAELARRAGVSTLTIDRVENGLPCRMDTKRKILEALGLNPTDRVMVFGEDD